MNQLSDRTLGDLLRAADSSPADTLPCVIQEVLTYAGVRNVALYLSDYEETLLRPAPGSRNSDGRPVTYDVDGTLPGVCLSERRLTEAPDGSCVWAPVVERADPLGVLELGFDVLDEEKRRLAIDAGIMVGHLLVTARKYTDVYELLRRRRDMNLAAEMHWEILPATHYFGPGVNVCGDLEPAYEVGGDAFDYCLNERTLNVAILDAMGHGLEAALLSTQAVGAYRYARRRRQSLVDTASIIEEALLQQFAGDKFVTGLLSQLDLATGSFRWIAAGHVAPLLVRDGRVRELADAPLLCPMGLDVLGDVQGAETELQEGDRVIFYSDGVIEARAPGGEYLELERLVELIELADHERGVDELVHGLIHEVVLHSTGPLRDDATVVGVEYLGPGGHWGPPDA
ncbi:PP2C family protein-serine/threonine phosphatase [soil metagenome]